MRLIDAEATEKEMLFWADTYGYGGLTKDNIREILRDTKKTPTVDAVEVIRCKDCKWFNDLGCAIRIIDDTDKPKETDFCSFAERRQDDY